MNAYINSANDSMNGVFPIVNACSVGVSITFKGSSEGKPANIYIEMTNYAAIQFAKNLVQAAENHAKATNKSVEYFRKQLNRKSKHAN